MPRPNVPHHTLATLIGFSSTLGETQLAMLILIEEKGRMGPALLLSSPSGLLKRLL